MIYHLYNFFLFIFQKGFVEAHVDDGLLEIFGLKQGWHASFVMVELISAKHIAQVLKSIELDKFSECLNMLFETNFLLQLNSIIVFNLNVIDK